MADRIVKQVLKDGAQLEIYCRRFPGCTADVPGWFRALFGAPEGLGWGEREPSGRRYLAVSGWERYYDDVFTGKSAGECTDYLYGALVDGKPAGRIWFGFSDRTKCGNFGNVETLPEFRKRGVMSAMLQEVRKDFSASEALFISCGAAWHAAPAYASIGFRRILGENNHAMALLKPDAGSFSDILQRAYGDARNAVIRPGRRGDRFDLDKLLAYAPEIEFQHPVTPHFFRDLLPDYMHTFQRAESGKAALSVIESRSGFCAGYACAEPVLPGTVAVTFTVHPAFGEYLVPLFRQVTRDFAGKLLFFPDTEEKQAALQSLGFTENQYQSFEISNLN